VDGANGRPLRASTPSAASVAAMPQGEALRPERLDPLSHPVLGAVTQEPTVRAEAEAVG